MRPRENEPEQPGLIRQMRQTFGAMHLFCAALCAPVAAMTTRPGTIGSKFMGLPMAAGAVVMVLVLGLTPVQQDEMVRRDTQAACLVGAFALCLIAHRIATTFGRERGEEPHSMYTGRPLWPGDELAAKGVAIPAILLFAGMVVVVPMTGVGLWLILASVSQAICTEIYKRGVRAQVRAMRDARIEQQTVITEFRNQEHR